MLASILVIILYALKLGINLAKHGQIEEREYNFGYGIISYIIIMTLLYFAGTFDSILK